MNQNVPISESETKKLNGNKSCAIQNLSLGLLFRKDNDAENKPRRCIPFHFTL